MNRCLIESCDGELYLSRIFVETSFGGVHFMEKYCIGCGRIFDKEKNEMISLRDACKKAIQPSMKLFGDYKKFADKIIRIEISGPVNDSLDAGFV